MNDTELFQTLKDIFFSAGILGVFLGLLYSVWGNGK